MSIRVYLGEHFDRGLLWRGILFALVLGMVIWSFWKEDRAGVILLLIVVMTYAYYEYTTHNDVYTMSIDQDGILVGKKRYLWRDLKGFYVTHKDQSNDFASIFLDDASSFEAYTFDASQEEVIVFLQVLSEYIPSERSIELPFFRKVMRRCRL